VVAQPVALADLSPGTYLLQVKAIDHVAGRHAIARADFVVEQASGRPIAIR
jgi:hypothetical protein